MFPELKYVETFGRWSALMPYTKHDKFSKLIAGISIFAVATNSAWKWDSLQLSYFEKKSDQIHYVLFQTAIFVSNVITRLAFLIAAPSIHRLFKELKVYLEDFKVQPTQKSVNRKFKKGSLIFMNFLFIGQIVEFTIRSHSNYGSAATQNFYNHCERRFLPCRTDQKFYWITYGFELLFKFLDSLTLYYLTYLGIALSTILLYILKGFEHKVIQMLKGEDRGNVDLDLVTPIFILKQHGVLTKDKKGESKGKRNKGLHGQFTRIKELYSSFCCALGIPLIVSTFADILVFICIVYSFIPRMDNGTGNGNVSGMGYGGMSTGYFPGENSQYIPPPDAGNVSQEFPQNQSNPVFPENGDTTFGFGAGGGYIPKAESRGNLSVQFSYIFAVLYEGRVVLLAFMGSFIKWRICKVKARFEKVFHEVRPCDENSKNCWNPSEEEDQMLELESLVNRFDRWKWTFRQLDMMDMDLSIIPTIFATVMTYVVVLLQIQISESNCH